MPNSTRPPETRSSIPIRSATRAGWLNARRDLHDAVAEPDPLGALAGRGQEHLGRARVGVLLEEVVLHLPDVVHADAVGQLDLLERVGDQPLLGVLRPGPRQLVLVEDPESHPDCRTVLPDTLKVVAAKIYTRKGDDGTTSLWYGGRVQKNDPRTEAYGTLDEANSALGVARAMCEDERLRADIVRLQEELFVAGAELATAPQARDRLEPGVTSLDDDMVAWMEEAIDGYMEEVEPAAQVRDPRRNAALRPARRRARRAAARRAPDRGPGPRRRAGGLARCHATSTAPRISSGRCRGSPTSGSKAVRGPRPLAPGAALKGEALAATG